MTYCCVDSSGRKPPAFLDSNTAAIQRAFRSLIRRFIARKVKTQHIYGILRVHGVEPDLRIKLESWFRGKIFVSASVINEIVTLLYLLHIF
jgi:hypothetical protein